ncbi:MAG: hypothetical protein QG589_48 [Patescibacteria group bacterium]|nr:hypothetical protein [Patescibacteria group bacterium]
MEIFGWIFFGMVALGAIYGLRAAYRMVACCFHDNTGTGKPSDRKAFR